MFNGILTRFEVKSCNSVGSLIAPLSETIRRTTPCKLDNIIHLFSEHSSINDVIAAHRATDQSIGYPYDDGTPRSGKLPILTLRNGHENLQHIRSHIVDHLHASNNTYLALVYKNPSRSVHVYYTGHGQNILSAPPLPQIRTASIKTYGTASVDAMRIALKISFEKTPGLAI